MNDSDGSVRSFTHHTPHLIFLAPSRHMNHTEKLQVHSLILLDESRSMEKHEASVKDFLIQTIDSLQLNPKTFSETQDHFLSIVTFKKQTVTWALSEVSLVTFSFPEYTILTTLTAKIQPSAS